jgi:general secretion pathway protein A
MDALEGFLRSLVPLESRAIVVMDEAQSLPASLLDEIRMLTAFERDGHRLIQVVLCGQPMLLNTLKTEPMYALNERITRRVALTPLSPAEVDAYIRHRLTVAGGTDTVTFRPESARLIAELSRGLPRRINVLCDRALQEGRVEGAMTIGSDLVKRAAKSLAGAAAAGPASPRSPDAAPAEEAAVPRPSARVPRAARIGLAAAGAVVVLGGAAYAYYGSQAMAGSRNVPALPAPPAVVVEQPVPPPAPTEDELKEISGRAAYALEQLKGGG